MWRTHSCVPCRDFSRHACCTDHHVEVSASTRVSKRHARVRAPLNWHRHCEISGLECGQPFGAAAAFSGAERALRALGRPGGLPHLPQPCYSRYVKIVVLDGYCTNPGDLSWDPLRQFGEVEVFDRTSPGEVVSRANGAAIALLNKT